MYEKGGLAIRRQKMEDGEQKNKREKEIENYEINVIDRFRYRTRYFSDSGIIGSKAFVDRLYQQFKDNFTSKHEKRPKAIQGLDGMYSLKRLSEAI